MDNKIPISTIGVDFGTNTHKENHNKTRLSIEVDIPLNNGYKFNTITCACFPLIRDFGEEKKGSRIIMQLISIHLSLQSFLQ